MLFALPVVQWVWKEKLEEHRHVGASEVAQRLEEENLKAKIPASKQAMLPKLLFSSEAPKSFDDWSFVNHQIIIRVIIIRVTMH
jgi:hypothetical protein